MFRILLLCLSLSLFAEEIDTFYGKIQVDEPVLIELIHSPAMQRLKSVHQYGITYYATEFCEEFNRYDHSVGVFAILRMKGASLEEQIAGLLHDVSHTAFSHVGDWVYGTAHQENDYQNMSFAAYLTASGVEAILKKYGFTSDEILPKNFHMLELQSLPGLNADRIDYNIQGAYHQHFLTKEKALEAFDDVRYVNGKWIFTKPELAATLMRFTLYMTEYCWTSAINHMISQWFAEAIVHGIELGVITWHDFHFGTDEKIWNALNSCNSAYIAKRLEKLYHPLDFFYFTDPDKADTIIKFRCRAIDPLILQKDGTIRVSELYPDLAQALKELRDKSVIGWCIKTSQD